MMSIDKSPSAILALCESFYRSNQGTDVRASGDTMYRLIQDGLTAYFKGLAILHEGLFPGWTADARNPGYLVRVDAPISIRAPYHIVPAFPSKAHLDAIWRISRSVKTIEGSLICLSGSAALFHSNFFIGDLDFCEYVNAPPRQISDALLTTKSRLSDFILFESLKFGNRPWTDLSEGELSKELDRIDPNEDEYSHAKVDFISKCEPFRPLEVSNVIIICDRHFKSASITRSFPPQEAHLDPSLVVPSKLADPFQIGRYVYWLKTQINILIGQGNYTKALKRSLSLSRLCFLPSLSDSITEFMRCSPDFISHEIESIDDVLKHSDNLRICLKNDWISELSSLRLVCVKQTEAASCNPISIKQFCQDVLRQFSSAFGDVAEAA